jgi:hypothetical protein
MISNIFNFFRKNSKSEIANPEDADMVVEIIRTDNTVFEKTRSRAEPASIACSTTTLNQLPSNTQGSHIKYYNK